MTTPVGRRGAIEAVFRDGIERRNHPPTINLHTPDEELDLDYVPYGKEKECGCGLSNSLDLADIMRLCFQTLLIYFAYLYLIECRFKF